METRWFTYWWDPITYTPYLNSWSTPCFLSQPVVACNAPTPRINHSFMHKRIYHDNVGVVCLIRTEVWWMEIYQNAPSWGKCIHVMPVLVFPSQKGLGKLTSLNFVIHAQVASESLLLALLSVWALIIAIIFLASKIGVAMAWLAAPAPPALFIHVQYQSSP